ncbi:extracellular solute-binding protein [Paramylibacter kogurei]|uniref:extracellular solute-binding protein n=1 Tax=Paramylibacter kogurei TaxID=1889778 RepID=UPI001F0AEB02|nr:extracellular solute-binding protein [Amylibacter kogurei]
MNLFSKSIWGAALGVGLMTLGTNIASAETIIKSHGISTFGELKYPADFEHFDYVNPDAPIGGTFSTWGFGTFNSVTPYILKGQAATLASAPFESLMTGGADEPDAMYGLLAESIEYPENRQWAIFNIRPEARFSDGSEVTAEDVVFSYNVLYEKGRPSFKAVFSDFESVEALDKLKVKFTFKEGSNTRELPQTAAGLPIFSKAYYADRDFSESTLEPPLGSGRYIIDKVDAGKSITFKRRDDYWGKDLNVNIGRENFDKIQIEYFTDYTAAFEAFKGGAYHYRQEYLSKLWATSYDFPSLEKGWVKSETLPDGNPTGTQGYFFNLRREKFQDPRVREAIGLMFNFEWSNKTLFYDLYHRTDSFWENSNMQASGPITPEELAILEPFRDELPESVFTEDAFTPPVSKPSQVDRAAVRRAGKLLDDAGWKVKDGVRQNEAGEYLTVNFLNDSPSSERITNPFIANLKRLGIQASMDSVDAAQAAEREKVFDYDITTVRYAMSLSPGIELRQIFGSATANAEGSANRTGLANPAIDAIIEKVEQAKTRDDLTVAVKALDRALRAMHIWVPQFYSGQYFVAYLDIYDHPENLPPYSLGEMDFWWYNAEKYKKLQAAGAIK